MDPLSSTPQPLQSAVGSTKIVLLFGTCVCVKNREPKNVAIL